MGMNIKSIRIKLLNYILHKCSFIFKCSDSIAEINIILGKHKYEIVSLRAILSLKSRTIIDEVYAKAELSKILKIIKSNNFSIYESFKQINLNLIRCN